MFVRACLANGPQIPVHPFDGLLIDILTRQVPGFEELVRFVLLVGAEQLKHWFLRPVRRPLSIRVGALT